MCSIALEKSCRVALNVIGNIAHSTCYHSFYKYFKNNYKKVCAYKNKSYLYNIIINK